MTGTGTARRVWVRHDLLTSEPESARRFFADVLDATAPVHAVAPGGRVGARWVGTLAVDGLDLALARAERAGASVERTPGGETAWVIDPCGAAFGLCEAASAQDAEPFFCWSELVAPDLSAAGAFYRDVLGWTSRGVDLGDVGPYRMFVAGDGASAPAGRDAGGLVPWVEGVPHPPLWLHYVAVPEIDLVFQRVGARGGRPLIEPAVIPGIGRYAVVAEPGGAVFGLFRAGT